MNECVSVTYLCIWCFKINVAVISVRPFYICTAHFTATLDPFTCDYSPIGGSDVIWPGSGLCSSFWCHSCPVCYYFYYHTKARVAIASFSVQQFPHNEHVWFLAQLAEIFI